MPLPCKISSGKVHHPMREALPSHIVALSKMQELVCTSSVCPSSMPFYISMPSGWGYHTVRLLYQMIFTLLRTDLRLGHSTSALECRQDGLPCATHLIFKQITQCIRFRMTWEGDPYEDHEKHDLLTSQSEFELNWQYSSHEVYGKCDSFPSLTKKVLPSCNSEKPHICLGEASGWGCWRLWSKIVSQKRPTPLRMLSEQGWRRLWIT